MKSVHREPQDQLIERTGLSKSVTPFLMRAFLVCVENPKLSLEDAMKQLLERDQELVAIVQSRPELQRVLSDEVYRRIRNQPRD